MYYENFKTWKLNVLCPIIRKSHPFSIPLKASDRMVDVDLQAEVFFCCRYEKLRFWKI